MEDSGTDIQWKLLNLKLDIKISKFVELLRKSTELDVDGLSMKGAFCSARGPK